MAISRTEKKKIYFDKLISLFQAYPKVLIVHADNVGSKQMSDIRVGLRGKGIMLMGKNTSIRTCMRQNMQTLPQLEGLLPYIKSNIGFVFCISDPSEVRDVIREKRVPGPARQGVLAPQDVSISAGPTGMDPGVTSFFQALGISTKIVKGQIEIQADVQVIKENERVSASASTLLQKLNIMPFSFGLKICYLYDNGEVYDSNVLDMQDETILQIFSKGTRNVAAMSRELGLPTEASIPHCLLEAFKNCVAMVLESDYTFPQMGNIKEYLKNPGAFSCAGGDGSALAEPGGAAVAAQKEPESEPEEEDDDLGFSLFD